MGWAGEEDRIESVLVEGGIFNRGAEVRRSRFFAHHPRTYPTELTLCGAPGTFGAPFTQNDTF